MRIIAGIHRSRIIAAVPNQETRPTADKIKGAIFSSIGPYFAGGTVLDLFGGSGNLGLEALSRGCDCIYFADYQQTAVRTINANIAALKEQSKCTVWHTNYMQALAKCSEMHLRFDIVFLDPPYKEQQIHHILTFLTEHALLENHGIVVCESLKEDSFSSSYGGLQRYKEKTYGITRISYYRDTSEEV